MKNVESSLSKSYRQNTLVIDKEKAGQYGITAGQIGLALNNYEKENVLSSVTKNKNTIDVVTVTETKDFNTMKSVLNTEIPTPTGTPIKLKEIVTNKKGKTASSVTRSEGKLYVTVSGELKSDKVNVSKVSSALQKDIDKIELTNGVTIETAGVTADMKNAFTQLGLAMLAAIGIVYFILVVTFKEALAPFAILFSLPLTIIGAVLGLLIAGETLSISGMLGLLMLIGIVVTNAIVLVDRILRNERQGMEIREAIIEAGETRLRPILMTAIATVGALIPLAIGAENSGGLISKGLGVTVIGGLTSSTLLTLLIVPMVYEFLSKLFKKDRKNVEEK